MNGTPAFQKLVEMCGLSTMFAGHAMARAIVRAGIWPNKMQPSDVPAVIYEVERAIKPFLDSDEVERVVEKIRASWWSHATMGEIG